MKIRVFPTGCPFDLHGTAHIFQWGTFRICMKIRVFPRVILWIRMEICIFYKGVHLWFACKYVYFQGGILWICIEIRIFYKGIPLECAWKYVYFLQLYGFLWICMEIRIFTKAPSGSAWKYRKSLEMLFECADTHWNEVKILLFIVFLGIYFDFIRIYLQPRLSIRIYSYLSVSIRICLHLIHIFRIYFKSNWCICIYSYLFHVAYLFVSILSVRMPVKYKQHW